VPGLLNALPLITSFELFAGDSGSTRFVMEKLMTVANKLGVSGSGLYCTFTRIHKNVFLSATGAGHPALILIRSNPMDFHQIPRPFGPADGPSFGFNLKMPLAEAQEQLVPGDTLIAYTDGVGEALCGRSQDQQVWEREIMRRAVDPAFGSCMEIAEGVMKAAEAAGPLHDDMTVCVIRMKRTGAD
jgi:hypothetical protein